MKLFGGIHIALAPLMFIVLALASEVRADPHGKEIKEPENKHIDVLFGFGVVTRFDDYIDFKQVTSENNPYLVIANDSRKRVTGMVGLGIYPTFGKCNCKRKRSRYGGFVSMNFMEDSSPAIDGLVVGANIELVQGVGVAIGYGLHTKSELSRGFRTAARRLFPDRDFVDQKNFDGLPLTHQGVPYYPSSPIVDSTNRSLFIGLTFSVDPRDLFKGH